MLTIVPYEVDNTMSILGGDFTVVPIDLYANETDFTVVDLGPAAIIPSVASFNTVSLLSQRLTVSNGTLRIDRSLGEYVVVTVQSNITIFEILNWPPVPFLGRIMLETNNSADYTIQWPSWIRWSHGRAPDLTINGVDRFLFSSVDNGITVNGDIVGMEYDYV